MGFRFVLKRFSILPLLYLTCKLCMTAASITNSSDVKESNLQALIDYRKLRKNKKKVFQDEDDREKKKETVRKEALRDKQNKFGKQNTDGSGREKYEEFSKKDSSTIECTQISTIMNQNCTTLSLTKSPLTSSSMSSFPTISPSESASFLPTLSPSIEPSFDSSSYPTNTPSYKISETPSVLPSHEPTQTPSIKPTKSSIPSLYPSLNPSNLPSTEPTLMRSSFPSMLPSSHSSVEPTLEPSNHPSTKPSSLPSTVPTHFPSRLPSILPTHKPSYVPSIEPSSFPTEHPSNPPSNFPSISLMPSIEPTQFPQNTCFFSQELKPESNCKDHLISNSTDDDRIMHVDDFLCSENKRYRFGITTDKYICLCDGDQKIWCADSCCERRRDPFLKLKRNGCVSAYADRFVGKREIWASDPNAIDASNDELSDKEKERLIRREREIRRLQVTNTGELVVVDHFDPNTILWEANLDFYVPFHPPTSVPTISIAPSVPPTTSPAPSISSIPSSSPIIKTNSPSVQATFRAGVLRDDIILGMRVSGGLNVRIIGEAGKRARYANRFYSQNPVHKQPDAGGCFDQPDGGWIYVSNSEVDKKGGGVGAFEFNANGDLENYHMIQTGTNMNCGGGKSPWGTWFSGEEFNGNPKGGMWEVDIRGGGARMTQFGRGKFESAICDDRDMHKLECFATVDEEDESLRRYQPSPRVLQDAVSEEDYSNVMHSPGGTLTYLLLNPALGRYTWTASKASADANAKKYYPNLEGIDHHDGKLYFVSKIRRELFVLDLDGNTYQSSTTKSGSFEAQPDQIAHIVGDDPNGNSYVYFLEDGGKEPGVFARSLEENKAFTIIEKIKDKFDGDEATGLAFCDNFTRMIFAFQERGIIYEVTRDDGLPFYGATANVKYHNTQFSEKTLRGFEIQDSRGSSSQDSAHSIYDSIDMFNEI